MPETRNAILIADCSKKFQELVFNLLRTDDILAHTADSSDEVLVKLKTQHYDMLLISLTFLEGNQIEYLRLFRKYDKITPVIVITSKNELFDLLYAFEMGADDCISHSINPLILHAKIQAWIRRCRQAVHCEKFLSEAPLFRSAGLPAKNTLLPETSTAASGDKISFGPFLYDSKSLRFYKNGIDLYLSAREAALLRFFMERREQILSKSEICQNVWLAADPDENTVNVYIRRIRRKIEENPSEPQYLLTIRGIGYRFTADKCR